MIGITQINLWNKALRLVGDYSITASAVAGNTGLYQMVQSCVREAAEFCYADLRGTSNLQTQTLASASLVSGFYELPLGDDNLFKAAYRFFQTDSNGNVRRVFDFTQPQNYVSTTDQIRVEFVAPPVNARLKVADDLIGTEPLGTFVFMWFSMPNVYHSDSNKSLVFHPLALEVVSLRAAQTLAIALNEDVSLAQTYAALANENLERLKKVTSLTVGRPFYATIKG